MHFFRSRFWLSELLVKQKLRRRAMDLEFRETEHTCTTEQRSAPFPIRLSLRGVILEGASGVSGVAGARVLQSASTSCERIHAGTAASNKRTHVQKHLITCALQHTLQQLGDDCVSTGSMWTQTIMCVSNFAMMHVCR